MDYIFASATLHDDVTHSEACHDLSNISDHIPLLMQLRWAGKRRQRGGDNASTKFRTNWQPRDPEEYSHKVAATLDNTHTHCIDSHARILQDSTWQRTTPQPHNTEDKHVTRLTARHRLAAHYDERRALSKQSHDASPLRRSTGSML